MTRAQLTAEISDVESLMFVNRVREMLIFELGKEIEKDVFSSCHEKNLFYSPSEKVNKFRKQLEEEEMASRNIRKLPGY